MSVREWLPSDAKTVVRILVALVILKLVLGFVATKLPASVYPFVPNLGGW
jgi:hypothetical protein